ncbi:MAG: M20/M25/M40 family metallo-hydrolase [Chloroflexota bacterium]
MRDLVRQHAREPHPFKKIADHVIEESILIQQIPAPTFAEGNRATYVEQQFTALGLQDVATDDMFNVFGLLPGEKRGVPGVMVMAHTDTVFPSATDLTIQRNNGTIHGPGLGDNSIGVAGLLGVVRTLLEREITPSCDIWFVATSREEGLGNLDGARMAYETLKTKIGAVINVEGLAYGYVYRAGIAVRRLHITAHADGGHSWLHFGKPSAIHAIVNLSAAITQLNPPDNPRTTFNIGIIEGGHSINSIATQASIWLDLRSEDTAQLMELEATVRELVADHTTDQLNFDINLVGDRPSGQIATTHPLIQGAMAALEENGVRGTLQVGSTDGNIPLSDGCPTVTVGITRGGNAHRTDEYIETGPVKDGMRQLLALILAAAQFQARSEV